MKTLIMEFVGPEHTAGELDKLIRSVLRDRFPEGSLQSVSSSKCGADENKTVYRFRFPVTFDARSLEYALEYSLQEKGIFLSQSNENSGGGLLGFIKRFLNMWGF